MVGRILRPILERRQGKVIPSHRWTVPHEEKLRALSHQVGWPGAPLVPSRITSIGEKLLGDRWKDLEKVVQYRVIWGGLSGIGPYARGHTIALPKVPPIWAKLSGIASWPAFVRRIAPHIPQGVELEAVLIHELIHVFEYHNNLFGRGEKFIQEMGDLPFGDEELVQKGLLGLHRLRTLTKLDPDEALPVLVELALYSPHELEILRRYLLSKGVDLYSLTKKHWGVNLANVKAPHDEAKVRTILMGVQDGK